MTQSAVEPGGRYVHRFRPEQVGTFWYHTHQDASQGVKQGIFGALVIDPKQGTRGLDLALPLHTFSGRTAIGTHDDVWRKAVRPGTMHLQGHHFLVRTRNGRAVSPWSTDTLLMLPHERYSVAFRAKNPGLWMLHCHNLKHAADGLTMHLIRRRDDALPGRQVGQERSRVVRRLWSRSPARPRPSLRDPSTRDT